MKNINEGKPLNNKAALSLDGYKGREINIHIKVDKDLHRKIMERKLDEDRTIQEIMIEVLEREFGK